MPQEQLRPRVLPPDPVPIPNPRPEMFTIDNGLQGFTYWMLTPESSPPTDKPTVLSQVATLSGIATPLGIHDNAGTIAAANTAQQAIAANPGRSWLLLYNPSDSAMLASVNTPSFESSVSVAPQGVLIGAGGALFWANAQGGTTVPLGAINIIGTKADAPYFAWDA